MAINYEKATHTALLGDNNSAADGVTWLLTYIITEEEDKYFFEAYGKAKRIVRAEQLRQFEQKTLAVLVKRREWWLRNRLAVYGWITIAIAIAIILHM